MIVVFMMSASTPIRRYVPRVGLAIVGKLWIGNSNLRRIVRGHDYREELVLRGTYRQS